MLYAPRKDCSFLSDFTAWEIIEIAEFQGRTCAIVEGRGAYCGENLGVETFEIIVDVETAIWMQFKGYNSGISLYKEYFIW